MTTERTSLDRPIDHLAPPRQATRKSRVGVFAIFDVEHDRDLYELLRVQSDSPGCDFTVIGGSKGASGSDAEQESVRRRIHKADQVVVICGEHTEDSAHIHSDLLLAQAEQKPYFLLWGRRGLMCTKPIGAKPAEGMYSWTGQFLNDQIASNLRNHSAEVEARRLRRQPRETKPPACSDDAGADAALRVD